MKDNNLNLEVMALIFGALCPIAQSLKYAMLSRERYVDRACIADGNQQRRAQGLAFGIEILLRQESYNVGNPKNFKAFLIETSYNTLLPAQSKA